MQTGPTDFIWRFIGELHIAPDAVRINLDYEGQEDRLSAAPEGQLVGAADPSAPRAFDDLDSLRSSQLVDLAPDPWFGARLRPLPRPELAAPSDAASSPPPLPPPPAVPGIGHGGGGGGSALRAERSLEIDVRYAPGGDQMDLRATQVNLLDDQDVYGPGDPAAWPIHEVLAIGSLTDMAAAAAGGPYEGTDLRSPASIVGALHERATQSPQDASLVGGITVDGHRVAGDGWQPVDATAGIPERPSDTHADVATIVTGANAAANVASLVNERGVEGTLIVLGDSYKSNVIVQTNVLVDSTVVGAPAGSRIQVEGNGANNTAEFIHALDQNPYAIGYFGGLHWHVDTLDGDFYAVNLVTQLNVLNDRDWVQQTATDHHKFVDTGENLQLNRLSEVNIEASHYDLVVVGGNYYAANWIFQTNILQNSDYVVVSGGAGATSGTVVSTGGNWLLNSATMIDFSGPARAMTPEMQAVATALGSHEGSLGLEAGFAVPGNGSLELNVLFISGNYYDLNVLKQTNVVDDSDKVLQSLGPAEGGYVATGGNVLTNAAILADVGPLGGQYVAGQQYSESVLVQTNIIVQSAETPGGQVVTNDPGKLAPEAAVLVLHSPPPGSGAADPVPVPIQGDHAANASSDPLSGIMS